MGLARFADVGALGAVDGLQSMVVTCPTLGSHAPVLIWPVPRRGPERHQLKYASLEATMPRASLSTSDGGEVPSLGHAATSFSRGEPAADNNRLAHSDQTVPLACNSRFRKILAWLRRSPRCGAGSRTHTRDNNHDAALLVFSLPLPHPLGDHCATNELYMLQPKGLRTPMPVCVYV